MTPGTPLAVGQAVDPMADLGPPLALLPGHYAVRHIRAPHPGLPPLRPLPPSRWDGSATPVGLVNGGPLAPYLVPHSIEERAGIFPVHATSPPTLHPPDSPPALDPAHTLLAMRHHVATSRIGTRVFLEILVPLGGGEVLCVTRDWFAGWQEGVRVGVKRRLLPPEREEMGEEASEGGRGKMFEGMCWPPTQPACGIQPRAVPPSDSNPHPSPHGYHPHLPHPARGEKRKRD